MSCQDPISDAIAVLKNALRTRKDEFSIPGSKLKAEIFKVLKKEGFIKDCRSVNNDKNSFDLKVMLKYHNGQPVITDIKRVSKSSRRVYVPKDGIKKVMNGLGIAILTTSHGVLTDYQARKLGIGGEMICTVW